MNSKKIKITISTFKILHMYKTKDYVRSILTKKIFLYHLSNINNLIKNKMLFLQKHELTSNQ